MRRVFTFVAFLGLFGCPKGSDLPPKPPPYEPSDRDSLDTPLGQACSRLRALGCPEGYPNRRGRTCFESLTPTAKLVPFPDQCIRASVTIEDVRHCGSTTTLRVRCDLPTMENAGSALP